MAKAKDLEGEVIFEPDEATVKILDTELDVKSVEPGRNESESHITFQDDTGVYVDSEKEINIK